MQYVSYAPSAVSWALEENQKHIQTHQSPN